MNAIYAKAFIFAIMRNVSTEGICYYKKSNSTKMTTIIV